MRITLITYSYKKKTKYYTFKQSEHELVLLKKLEDNKIFYNNSIYDTNFFYYYKLEGFIEKIYKLRNEYIQENWINYYNVDSDDIIKVWNFKPDTCDELKNLTSTQYDILVKAYKYEFPYTLTYDLLTEEPGIIFYPDDLIPINTYFADWFYKLGWSSIKPVYPTFMAPFHYHYCEDFLIANKNRVMQIKNHLFPGTERGYDFVFRNTFLPVNERNILKTEWYDVEYDEQKKFSEFDISCQTNSYYMRYKAYNEIHNKDYPEDKKFKTELELYDFTEEEIKENYENMIDKEKTAKDKFNYVVLNQKNKAAVFKFFSELESIEVSEEKRFLPPAYFFDFKEEDEDSTYEITKRVELELYEFLNDPRHILVKPLIDAYFELFREKLWEEDKVSNKFNFYPMEKKIHKQVMYFDMSYERLYWGLTVNKEIGQKLPLYNQVYDEYSDLEDEELEDHYEDEYILYGFALLVLIWLVGLTCYVTVAWFGFLNVPYNSPSMVYKYYESWMCYFTSERPKTYYGIELRRPRTHYKIGWRKPRAVGKYWRYRLLYRNFYPYQLPPKFYDELNYRFKQTRRFFIPYDLLGKLNYLLNEEDFGLYKLHRNLQKLGQKYYLHVIRFIWLEELVAQEDQPFRNIAKWIIDKMVKIIVFIFVTIRDLLHALYELYCSYSSGDKKK